MDNFNEYLNGSKFTLYKDPVPETSLGTTQLKMLNRLKTAMSEHDFEIKDKQKSDLPNSLKNRQKEASQTHVGNPGRFNKTIHVDTFSTLRTPEKIIITIMDNSTAFSVSTITTDNSATSTVTALQITGSRHMDIQTPSLSNKGRYKPVNWKRKSMIGRHWNKE
jgi:hypothetical protein